MPGVPGFGNVLFPVDDFEEAVAFYERAGFAVTHRLTAFDEGPSLGKSAVGGVLGG
ncbi:hypothetical protein [Streptomyces kanamyceticus]|uniref:hypothetical protein n=1 Tax=Streptomyces kanamyceticus TaxID=1967 RepID=UPI0012FF45CE